MLNGKDSICRTLCLLAGAPKVEVREQKTQEGEAVETVKDSVCGMEIDNVLGTSFFSQFPGSIAATVSKPSGGNAAFLETNFRA